MLNLTEVQKGQLTEEDLRTLINIVAQANVPVGQAQPFIDLINKMSLMIDDLRKPPTLTQTPLQPPSP